MATHREASNKSWNTNQPPTVDEINLGSLQRIADAVEKMTASYDSLRDERDLYQTWYREEGKAKNKATRRISALRGVITRMKKAKAKDAA